MQKIIVSVSTQKLFLHDANELVKQYDISTSKHGCGEIKGTFKTPRGKHIVRAKIGQGLASNAILIGRRPTGNLVTKETIAKEPDRDWIVSRILWLSGCEPGRNRLGDVDTMSRYIYIHGTPHEEHLGTPESMGCVRMSGEDVIELYDLVATGISVDIEE